MCVCEGVRVWCEGMWVGRGAVSKFESVSVQFYLSLFSFPSPFFFSTLLPLPLYRSFFPPLPSPKQPTMLDWTLLPLADPLS